MNVRTVQRPEAASTRSTSSKPAAVALPLDAGTTPAANHDHATDDEPDINPLWMISVALAILFGFLAILAVS